MKRNSLIKIEEALAAGGVEPANVESLAERVWSSLFYSPDRVQSAPVLAALVKAKEAGAFPSWYWLGRAVGNGPNYFPTLKYQPRSMPYDVAYRACELAGLDLDAVLREAG